jgi:uncharacterized protein (TIGR02646 family)
MPFIKELPNLSEDLESYSKDFHDDPVKHLNKDYWENLGDKDKLLIKFKKNVKTHYIKIQNNTCAYCRCKVESDKQSLWPLEHIVPRSIKPRWTLLLKNLCVVCDDCNEAKGNKNTIKNKTVKNLPSKKESYLIVNPHFDIYKEHICIVSVGELYLPLSEKGHTTFDYCGFSRFLKKLAGVGSSFANNHILMQRILDSMAGENDPAIFKKLNDLMIVVAKSNDVILKENSDDLYKQILQSVVGSSSIRNI